MPTHIAHHKHTHTHTPHAAAAHGTHLHAAAGVDVLAALLANFDFSEEEDPARLVGQLVRVDPVHAHAAVVVKRHLCSSTTGMQVRNHCCFCTEASA